MSRLSSRQDQAVQAIGQVAQLGGLQIKKITVADDLENISLTVIFTGVSKGWTQEVLDFEREDLRVHVNGRGEVERIDGLAPGDLAETGAEAEAEIAAAAETKAEVDPDEKPSEPVGAIAETPDDEEEPSAGVDLHDIAKDMHPGVDDDPRPAIHLVGEAAAAARKRR